MTKSIALLPLLALALASCSSGENDGRKYYTNNSSPIAGKMGVTYRRVKADNPPPASETPAQPRTAESDGLLGVLTGGHSDEPAGLLDRNEKPDEPGAQYWMHARQSPDPIAGKMGVRVTRLKK
ncbi:hypothetical protein [Brevifollis gellanilyticus]|uniref:Lipoprotein n=1 Tax=Brevifollis gellanilyticus TaxID=748831 RepID=A0A512MCX4_9BACT|nr:hypothetical protein [Brevifollis gellanilyticus]GEP44578.1 hypothetical protein BGE01nite_38690 [Brevifollis gellanilyticus]